MTTLRGLAIFGLLTVLTGCLTKPCGLPGRFSSDPGPSCYYQLKINQVDEERHLVKAQLPDWFKIIEEKDGELTYEYRKVRSEEYRDPGEFTFFLRNFEKAGSQLAVNKVHEFIRQGNSPSLELVPGKPRPDEPPPQPQK